MRRITTILLFLSVFLTCNAQDLTVRSMTAAPFDLSAAAKPVNDYNGIACGLVKVRLASPGAVFGGNVMQPVEYKTGEYWVYMTAGSYLLEVKHPNFLPLNISFRDYGIQRVESNCTYILTLVMPSSMNEDMQYLVLRVSPANAIVFVDDQMQQVQNGIVSLLLPHGMHSYRVDAFGYETKKDTVQLGSQRKTVDIKLLPSANQSVVSTGSLNVNYQPFDSEVWLDGKLLGTSPNVFKDIAVGSHTVEIKSAGMKTATHTVNVLNGETALLSGSLIAESPNIANPPAALSSSESVSDIILGTQFRPVTEATKKQFNISSGLEVMKVGNGSMKDAGITKGFIFLKVNDENAKSLDDLQKIVNTSSSSKEPVLYVVGIYPSGKKGYFAIPIVIK